jgi:hypothetical protein
MTDSKKNPETRVDQTVAGVPLFIMWGVHVMRLMDSNGRKMKPDREGCALQTIDELTQEKGQKGTIKMALPKVCEVPFIANPKGMNNHSLVS